MILIFGGAYQGKLAYAMERFNLTESSVYRCDDSNVDIPDNKKAVYETDKWILALIKAGKTNAEIEQTVQQFILEHRDSVVICNDISCGVVPTDPVLRKWREAVGRTLALCAQNSEEVIRLFCSIPTRLK